MTGTTVITQEGPVRRLFLQHGQTLPLVIQPAVEELDLSAWAQSELEALEQDLLKHGAILFRGFGIDSPEKLERFADSVCSDLFEENGEHPHESLSGNVYTPVFYSPSSKLLWHNENSFNFRWPRKIFFCCVQPTERGGETPIVDSRKIFDSIDPEIRQRFLESQVAYQRNYGKGMGLTWQEVFHTENPQEVEQYCQDNAMQLEWTENDGLRTLCIRPAAIPHPKTREMSWFNQAQHWHLSCLDPSTRESLLSLFAEEALPRNCYFGDGERIPDAGMRNILEAYQRLEVVFAWQKGDVLLLDNVLTAHGRNPFEGERKLLVAMGDMMSFGDI